MNRTVSIVVTVALVVALTATVNAQTPTPAPTAPPAASRSVDRSDLRHQIYVMEGALARAVSFGAQRLNREIRSVVPEMIALSGEPQARGVYLEGYGVFFDVGVPILHQSMVWSLRTMLTPDPRGVAEALNVLRENAKQSDAARRAAIENALSRIELQIGPLADATGADIGVTGVRQAGPGVGASILSPELAPGERAVQPGAGRTAPAPLTLDKRYLQDPNALNRAYTDSVQRALIDAMIDYSAPMAISADEFLTVGARDNMQRDSLAPADPYEEVVTVLLRVRGADLAAYRARQIDREEVRRRVQILEF
ncbi:MAG: hypothetical protein ACT4QD_02020 [Acidobacteriota bacterium]